MKKILSEGLLVGFFLLLGVSYAQNLRTAQKTPIIPSQKELLSSFERNATRKCNYPPLPQTLLKSSNTNSTFVADTVVVQSTREDSRYSFTYDSYRKIASELYEYLNNGRFEFRYRKLSTYDNTNRTKAILVESWNNGQWNLNSRSIYSYDNAGKEISALYQHWSYNVWENSLRFSRTFTQNGDQT